MDIDLFNNIEDCIWHDIRRQVANQIDGDVVDHMWCEIGHKAGVVLTIQGRNNATNHLRSYVF